MVNSIIFPIISSVQVDGKWRQHGRMLPSIFLRLPTNWRHHFEQGNFRTLLVPFITVLPWGKCDRIDKEPLVTANSQMRSQKKHLVSWTTLQKQSFLFYLTHKHKSFFCITFGRWWRTVHLFLENLVFLLCSSFCSSCFNWNLTLSMILHCSLIFSCPFYIIFSSIYKYSLKHSDQTLKISDKLFYLHIITL